MRHTGVVVTIRFAKDDDGEALSRLDVATMSSTTSPGIPSAGPDSPPFFTVNTTIYDVIVADEHGAAVGYVKLEKPTPLPSNSHVLLVGGLAVDPSRQKAGIGRMLIDAAVRESSRRGARKLSLRVLSTNSPAQRLYEQCGFTVEGVLHEEFFLDGQYVDDILMARPITNSEAEGTVP